MCVRACVCMRASPVCVPSKQQERERETRARGDAADFDPLRICATKARPPVYVCVAHEVCALDGIASQLSEREREKQG